MPNSSFSPLPPAPPRLQRLAAWWRRARVVVSDSLREHPIFTLDERNGSGLRPGLVEAKELSETDRESLFEAQLLRIFGVRIRLAAAMGLVFLPIFTAFYFLLFDGTPHKIVLVNGLMMLGLTLVFGLAMRLNSLGAARLLALTGYLLFALGSATAISIVASVQSFDSEAVSAVHFVVMASFLHILISTLLLPFRWLETLAAIGIVLGALGAGVRATPPDLQSSSSIAAVFVMGTIAVVIALLSHFNERLRRRVFDSAFNLALQAAHMKAISQTDALTGGSNRRYAETVLATELARAARFSRPLSLLMFDLDNFKPVNDTLGHPAGDGVLQAVHQIARAELREVDMLARYGGDEFLILLPETDRAEARQIAARLRDRVLRELPARFGVASLAGQVTLSIGVLTLALDPLSVPAAGAVETILNRVDALLYSAKNQGKNRIVSNA